MKIKASIIDYGLCNLYNVSNALEHVGADISIIDKPEQINKASHIILPGVGAFKNGMRGLKLRGLIDPIKEHIEKKHPSGEIIFIGDGIENGGNDYPLAELMDNIEGCDWYHTIGWEHTLKILKEM